MKIQDVEDESIEVNNVVRRSTSARRSRAAEVHNLSERVKCWQNNLI